MIPQNIQKVLDQFFNLQYVLFKCEHILEGQNKNVDILLNDEDYEKASLILERSGFVLYMPESIEKYKRMYVLFHPTENSFELTAIHLHREVAWHGVIALSKKEIIERAKNHIPSPEDSLLIHSAHALFENFKLNDYHKTLLERYKILAKDQQYIDFQLEKYGWRKEFKQFISTFVITPRIILSAYMHNLLKRPHEIPALSTKTMKALLRKISVRRRGYLIALLGMNGTGKTTLQQNVLQEYFPLTKFVSGQYGYYFGWKSTFVSKILARSTGNKKTFEKVTTEKVKPFHFFQELLFLYIYGEYLWRYYTHIYPTLRKNYLVICDRYFYDLFGQYPYSKKSVLLPFLYFPKPDALFILDADVETVMKRGKTGKEERKVQPKEKLEGQRQRYLEMAMMKKGTILNMLSPLEKNKQQVVSSCWKAFLTK